MLYAQLLIAASFVIAAYQDVRERSVNDLVWVPAIAGVAFAFYVLFTSGTPVAILLVKIGLVGGIGLAFVYFGFVGQADAIALALIASDPYQFSPFPALVATAVIAISHIAYELAVGNARGGHVVSLEKFLAEQRWIPRALVKDGVRTEVDNDVNVAREEVEAKGTPGSMVEVSYGVPTVAYLGIGYAVYLAYLIIFLPVTFAALP